MVGQSTQEPTSVLLVLMLSRQIHLCHNKYVQAAFFSCPEGSSVHTIHCKLILYVTGKLKKVFPSILALLGPFCSCVLLVKHQRFLENNFANNSNDKTTFVACRKARKLVFTVFHLAVFEYFRPGIIRFDWRIRIKHFTSCARVVDRQPWVRGWEGVICYE